MNIIVTWGPIEGPIQSEQPRNKDGILTLDDPIGLQVYNINPSQTD